MSLFNDILKNISTKIESNTAQKELIQSTVREVLGVTLSPDAFVLKDSKLRIMAPATLKMTIQLKQPQLLAAFHEKGIKVVAII